MLRCFDRSNDSRILSCSIQGYSPCKGAAYLETRPPLNSERVFTGNRGPLIDCGIRAFCDKHGAIIGVKLHSHLLRRTVAHKFLEDNNNDSVSPAQIVGHDNLNKTAPYTKRTEEQLGGGCGPAGLLTRGISTR